jgi:Protein of unknown function (DUF2442)
MKSAKPGTRTSAAEVTNVSRWGFWLLVGERELFVSFEHFPWFREVPIGQPVDVTMPHPGHLHWPHLDVDLAVDSIEHPERYPLASKAVAHVAEPAPKRSRR